MRGTRLRTTPLAPLTPFLTNESDDRSSEPRDTHKKQDSDLPRNQHPWTFGEEAVEITKKYTGLRYKLLPYLYNEFRDSSESGKPIFQPCSSSTPPCKGPRHRDDRRYAGETPPTPTANSLRVASKRSRTSCSAVSSTAGPTTSTPPSTSRRRPTSTTRTTARSTARRRRGQRDGATFDSRVHALESDINVKVYTFPELEELVDLMQEIEV